MKTARATDVKNKFGQYLDNSMVEPVVIEKNGRPVAVMLSFDEYERFTQLEDAYWIEKALEAEKEGFLGPEESMKFIKSR